MSVGGRRLFARGYAAGMTENSSVSGADGVLSIAVSSPANGTSLDGNALDEAIVALTALHAGQRNERVILLHGSGKNFCAGGNVASFATAADRTEFLADLADRMHRMIALILESGRPVVVAAKGWAAGAGMSLTMLGDVVVGGPSTKMRPAYRGIGLSPDGGMTWSEGADSAFPNPNAAVDLLKTRARTLVYATGLPPASAGAALAALDIIDADPGLTETPLAKARLFTRRLGLPDAESPIVPVIFGGAEAALAASAALENLGFLVVAIRPPTVPEGTARLRLAFSAVHDDADVVRLADAIAHLRKVAA